MPDHYLSDEMISEFWPEAKTAEDRDELRKQFHALMAQLRRVWFRRLPRHHELFAQITAEKAKELPIRVAELEDALAGLPNHWHQYQWKADKKPVFGEKYIRSVYGDNGNGAGRQAIAVVPHQKEYFGTVADFIAAANPDTVTMLLARLRDLETQTPEIPALDWEDPSSKNNQCWVARTIIGEYWVAFEDGWDAGLEDGPQNWEWEPEHDRRSYEGPHAAMKACQQHYLSVLESALRIAR